MEGVHEKIPEGVAAEGAAAKEGAAAAEDTM